RRRSGSRAGSGLPSARSRRPGETTGAGRTGRGGRGTTRGPRRPSPAARPRTRSVRDAAAAAAGLRRGWRASARTGGGRAPGASRPSRIARSTLAAISLALPPVMPYCVITFTSSYCNINEADMSDLSPTPRTTLKRLPARGRFDRATVDAILDEGLVCHVGFVAEEQPFVIPTI